MARIIKSVFWLGTLGGLGYGLYLGLTPSEEKIKQLRKDLSVPDTVTTRNKNQQFLDVLKAAAESNKPLYRMNPQEATEFSKESKQR